MQAAAARIPSFPWRDGRELNLEDRVLSEVIRKKLQIAKDSPDFWCWKAHTQASRVWKVERVARTKPNVVSSDE